MYASTAKKGKFIRTAHFFPHCMWPPYKKRGGDWYSNTFFFSLEMPGNTLRVFQANFNLQRFFILEVIYLKEPPKIPFKTRVKWPFSGFIFVPITSFDGPLLGFKKSRKSRSRGKDEKLRQEKAKMRKKTKHWNMKKPNTKCGGFSGSLFTIKLGKI